MLSNKPIIEVKKIKFRNDETGFTVASVKFKEYYGEIPTSEPVIVGSFYKIKKGDEMEVEGDWTRGQYGMQFKVTEYSIVKPQSIKAIEKFLKQHGGKGTRKKTIENIVAHFGFDTLDKIYESWKNLLEVKGVTKKTAMKIGKNIQETQDFSGVWLDMLRFSFSFENTLKVYNEFGSTAYDKISNNPYVLLQIPGIGIKTADEVAKYLKIKHNDIRRVKATIEEFLINGARNRGNLFEFKEDIIEFAPEYMLYAGDPSFKEIEEEDIKKELEEMIKAKKIIKKINNEGRECFYSKALARIEKELIDLLGQHSSFDKPTLTSEKRIKEWIMKYEKESGFTLAKNQKEAVINAVRSNIFCLTGGPGTGKTQTINTIINCIEYFAPHAEVELLAPTGKASKRMTELTGKEAQTIHRRLGIFEEDSEEVEEIESEFVIIDECSMIDAVLYKKLMDSLGPDTRIIFVGDANQLQSIGAGSVFRDTLGVLPTVELNEIFRQAKESQIVMNAHKIINGIKTDDKKDPVAFDHSKGDFYFINKENLLDAQRALLKSVENMIKNKGYKLSDIQVLCPMKKGDLGTGEINRIIQSLYNPKSKDKKQIEIGERVFRVGDRVIQLENDYEQEIFNGEMGIITGIEEEDGEEYIIVEVDGKDVIYDRSTAGQIMLAYAMTIHKAQGSEFPVVIMPVHQAHAQMLNRNLIYTGLTRAKESIVMIGTESALNEGIDKIQQTQRNSLIKEQLERKLRRAA